MLFVVATILVATYLVAQRLQAWYRLRHIKGPSLAAFSDIWMLKRVWKGTLYEDLGDLCAQYGKRPVLGLIELKTRDCFNPDICNRTNCASCTQLSCLR